MTWERNRDKLGFGEPRRRGKMERVSNDLVQRTKRFPTLAAPSWQSRSDHGKKMHYLTLHAVNAIMANAVPAFAM